MARWGKWEQPRGCSDARDRQNEGLETWHIALNSGKLQWETSTMDGADRVWERHFAFFFFFYQDLAFFSFTFFLFFFPFVGASGGLQNGVIFHQIPMFLFLSRGGMRREQSEAG